MNKLEILILQSICRGWEVTIKSNVSKQNLALSSSHICCTRWPVYVVWALPVLLYRESNRLTEKQGENFHTVRCHFHLGPGAVSYHSWLAMWGFSPCSELAVSTPEQTQLSLCWKQVHDLLLLVCALNKKKMWLESKAGLRSIITQVTDWFWKH